MGARAFAAELVASVRLDLEMACCIRVVSFFTTLQVTVARGVRGRARREHAAVCGAARRARRGRRAPHGAWQHLANVQSCGWFLTLTAEGSPPKDRRGTPRRTSSARRVVCSLVFFCLVFISSAPHGAWVAPSSFSVWFSSRVPRTARGLLRSPLLCVKESTRRLAARRDSSPGATADRHVSSNAHSHRSECVCPLLVTAPVRRGSRCSSRPSTGAPASARRRGPRAPSRSRRSRSSCGRGGVFRDDVEHKDWAS